MQKILKNFKNKRVIITGHTGFKGSWLSLWLYMSGAKIMGISNGVLTKPSHFDSIKLKKTCITKTFSRQEKRVRKKRGMHMDAEEVTAKLGVCMETIPFHLNFQILSCRGGPQGR